MVGSLWTCPRCGRTFATTNQTYTCAPLGDLDEHFRGKDPSVRAIFDLLRAHVEPVEVLAERTRIAFHIRMSFAAFMPRRHRLDGHLILARSATHPAFVKVEVYSPRNVLHAFRLSEPPEVASGLMLAVAIAGLAANGVSLYLLRDAQEESLNMRGAYLEVLSDLLGSVAVIVAAAVFLITGFQLIDVLASIFIGLFILPRTWSLIYQAVHALLEGAPRNVDLPVLRQHILDVEGVVSVHDLHVWNLTSGMNVMSAHVVVEENASSRRVLDQLNECLGEHFDIEHSTIQIERADRSAREHAAH